MANLKVRMKKTKPTPLHLPLSLTCLPYSEASIHSLPVCIHVVSHPVFNHHHRRRHPPLTTTTSISKTTTTAPPPPRPHSSSQLPTSPPAPSSSSSCSSISLLSSALSYRLHYHITVAIITSCACPSSSSSCLIPGTNSPREEQHKEQKNSAARPCPRRAEGIRLDRKREQKGYGRTKKRN